MRICGVETSSRIVSVALLDGDHVTSLSRETRGDAVVEMIAELLRSRGLGVRDVERWAVDVGPGSFTGVRTGVSTVKGIAFATGAEIVGVNAFDVVAFGAHGSVAIALPAGKGELYFRIDRGEPGHASIDEVKAMLAARADLVVIGPDVVPTAENVVRVAIGRTPDDVDRLEPLYVRAPDLTRPS